MAVRLAATGALFNALEFAQTNFENADERNYIMQMICQGTIAPEANLREASFECLVKIAAHYYAKLPAYMNVRSLRLLLCAPIRLPGLPITLPAPHSSARADLGFLPCVRV